MDVSFYHSFQQSNSAYFFDRDFDGWHLWKYDSAGVHYVRPAEDTEVMSNGNTNWWQ